MVWVVSKLRQLSWQDKFQEYVLGRCLGGSHSPLQILMFNINMLMIELAPAVGIEPTTN